MKNKNLAGKVVKYGTAGTATLTRVDNQVYASKDGSTLFNRTFLTNAAARHYMGATTQI